MSHVFFRKELEGVATYWRVHRRDGVTQGFTTHDKDLWFDGVLHRAAPGMLPSAIRRTSDLSADSAEVEGALSHGSISEADLASGRYDAARVEIGAVDWETLDHSSLYNGTIGAVSTAEAGFTAELRSAKAQLDLDPVPRTSPTCRAEFCGPGCGLSAIRYTQEAAATSVDLENNRVSFAGLDHALFTGGSLRWIDGPQAGQILSVAAGDANGMTMVDPLSSGITAGLRAQLIEGCDHTLQTCHARFVNALNFQGEPFLPGNDLLARYPAPPQ